MIDEIKNGLVKYLKPIVMNKYVMASDNPNLWMTLEVILITGLILLGLFIIADMLWDIKKGLKRMAQ